MALNRNLPPVRTNQFAMVPKADVPRSTFKTQHSWKATYQGNFLYPCFIDEVLPGDTFKGDATMFMRMQTPLFPIMDDICVETFFFYVPNRLVWDNWVKLMGERKNPTDTIDFTVPYIEAPVGGFQVGSIADHFGIPCNVAGIRVNAMPFRAYNLIWNEWFRDQNLSQQRPVSTGDGPDLIGSYELRRRFKRHDYFTSALPWPTKNNDLPSILVGGAAPVFGIGGIATPWTNINTGATGTNNQAVGLGHNLTDVAVHTRDQGDGTFAPYVWADLSQATGATVNSLRLAVATQQLLERDARGGTRYTETIRSHFGVLSPDSRLQRPEYIGGGKFDLKTQAIPQTSEPTTESPLGALGGATTGADQHRFSYSAVEHGFIIGLVHISGPQTYQYGLHRMWTRESRYDYYWPAFAFLGEQAIRNDEIYAKGSAVGADDAGVWGYQERWAEYRHRQSRICGFFRSNATGSLDTWHLAQDWADRPTLSEDFLSDNTPFERILAAGDLANNQQFLMDSVWRISCTRALPVRSVPGLTRF